MPLQFVNGMMVNVPYAGAPATAAKVQAIVDRMATGQTPAYIEEQVRAMGFTPMGGNGMNGTPIGLPPAGRFIEPPGYPVPTTTGTPVPANGNGVVQAGPGAALATIPAALGLTGVAATGLAGLLALVGSRIKFPWQTPEGEGFIAPWTQQAQTPTGLWGQEGVQYAGGAVVPAGGFAGAGFGQQPMQAWNNAAKDGSTPATAEYIRLAKRSIAVRSLKTGVISKYRLPYTIGIHTNMSMGKFLKADVMLDRFTRRLARRSKRLKLQ